MSAKIVHSGVVLAVNNNDIVIKTDVGDSDCSGCAIAAMCSKGEQLTLPCSGASPDLVGKRVRVEIAQASSRLATILYLAIPLVLIVLSLGIPIDLGLSEAIAALITAVVLALWYLLVYLFKPKARLCKVSPL